MDDRHDIRGLANYILDLAATMNVGVTNMAINKIVYFVYADYLFHFGRAPSSARIEAWEHGPVFREVYASFKSEQDRPIRIRASRIDAASGVHVDCQASLSREEKEFVDTVARNLIPLPASKLRQISHEPGGPWDRVWNHQGSANVGMLITDQLILSCANSSRRQ